MTSIAGQFLRDQSKTWLKAAREVGLETPVGPLLSGAHDFVTQEYIGDITIHPRFDPSLYMRMFSNPPPDILDQFVLEGQRATWPEIEKIRNQTAIGRALQHAMDRMKIRIESGEDEAGT